VSGTTAWFAPSKINEHSRRYRAPVAEADVSAVLITGGLATGKTAVSTAIGGLLETQGAAGCVVDLDWLCWAWSPRLDPTGIHRLLCDNLRILVPRLLAEGLFRLVLCRTLLEPGHIRDVRGAVGVPMQVIRLTVSHMAAEQRLRQRDSGQALATHLAELESFAAAAELAAIGAPVVDTTGRATEDVANELLAVLGWSDTRPH
jgi:hypothetical protein